MRLLKASDPKVLEFESFYDQQLPVWLILDLCQATANLDSINHRNTQSSPTHGRKYLMRRSYTQMLSQVQLLVKWACSKLMQLYIRLI